jgi:uncharacterized protein (DUF1015 family)
VPDIAPLRGILYDPSRVDPGKVIAPPYDVIDPDERGRLAAADPHNCVRLILPEADGGADKYQAAAKTLDAWLASGVLKRDDRKAVYRYNQVFTHPDLGDRPVTRTGFIAGVRLHDFAEKVILPHERTLRGPKEDRLALMKATSAHFSQIFTMFKDSSGEVERLFKKTETEKPIVDATTADGVRHLMWRCNDAEMIGKLRHHMAPKKLYIADGHHRYETMLALRAHFAAGREGGLSTYSSAQYGTMFLSTMDQEGLVVLPTHRILHSLQGFTAAGLLEKARELFIVDKIENGVAKPQLIRKAVTDTENHQPAFAVVFPGESHAWRFTLDPQSNSMVLGLASKTIAKLDVTLLHSLVLERILGITPAAQEAQTNLRYVKDTAKAIAEAGKPGTQAVFLMTPSGVDKVKQVCDGGEIMPQKSTYFFPKIASGLVINRIDPDEDLI